MRSEDKQKAIAAAELEWFFVDRISALGAKGVSFEPSASIAWEQSRVDAMHERRVKICGLVGTRRWDKERMRYAETVAERERRIGARVRESLSPVQVKIATARWESFGGDATIAALAFVFRNEPGTYLGIAISRFAIPEVDEARDTSRPRKVMVGDHVVTMPGRPEDRGTALDYFKRLATSARRRVAEYRDEARRAWLQVVASYAEGGRG